MIRIVALALTASLALPGVASAGTGVVRWSPALRDGDPVHVRVDDGTAALVPGGDTEGAHGLGLLTLPARPVAVPVDRVEATVDADGAVAVDVRCLRNGRWTEWLPAAPAVTLPGPVTRVQARLVFFPGGAPGRVRRLTLAAYPATGAEGSAPPAPPAHYRVFATREGLVGGTTSNGHVITENDMFVALPSRRALSPRDASDYSVKVCAATGRCAFAPVWDVGPWNTRDDYWNPADRRENWSDLPQGMPQSQAAKTQGYHGGKDQFGRTVLNPAGIDLADGLFRDGLQLTGNDWVTVDYLWTGAGPTAQLDRRADVRSAPNKTASVVGLAAAGAGVPLQCVTGRWLRIGTGQFLASSAVPKARWPRHLPTCR